MYRCAAGEPIEADEPCKRCGATIHDVCGPHYEKACKDRTDLETALEALMPADFDQHPDDFAPEWHAARAALERAKAGQ